MPWILHFTRSNYSDGLIPSSINHITYFIYRVVTPIFCTLIYLLVFLGLCAKFNKTTDTSGAVNLRDKNRVMVTIACFVGAIPTVSWEILDRVLPYDIFYDIMSIAHVLLIQATEEIVLLALCKEYRQLVLRQFTIFCRMYQWKKKNTATTVTPKSSQEIGRAT
ncbi:hypothetical protein DdX_18135 [Ditylenchus destructor]|uniref:Uncharacterized protein n=1 Tax=Ditylenchus destructor TaxID=166010 RepID=A0AAD4QYD0_9BILA|nr:hypothetical protein DdX_18135 [Ditylenchus destructor]